MERNRLPIDAGGKKRFRVFWNVGAHEKFGAGTEIATNQYNTLG